MSDLTEAELEEEIAAQAEAEEEELAGPLDQHTQQGYEDDILKDA